jgi:AcrR family transcriptional regulator
MMPEVRDRVLRADAQLNLERILEAARETFADEGSDASVTTIAELAGVGVATIFRRFPTKDDLLAAVLEQRVAGLIDAADAALAGGGLHAFMAAATAAFIGDRCLCDAAGTDLFARAGLRERVDALDDRLRALLARAQEAGEVRRDVTAQDIPLLLMAVSQAGLALEAAAPGSWRRYLGIVYDGLRPEGSTRLPGSPLTRRQFEAARSARPR